MFSSLSLSPPPFFSEERFSIDDVPQQISNSKEDAIVSCAVMGAGDLIYDSRHNFRKFVPKVIDDNHVPLQMH